MPRLIRLGLYLGLAVIAQTSHAAEGLAAFVQAHCAECHGADVQKAGLRLDTLAATFDDADVAATWVKVLDKVAAGEMPPKKKARPPEAERAAVLAELNARLHAASLARQRRDGRVVLRRLNRTEYQNTLGDLLGVRLDLKNVLPDESAAAGFDNVAAALDVSSVHLLRYQDAAERAILDVIPTRPPTPIKERRTGRQVTEKARGFADMLGTIARLEGDTLVMYARPYAHIPCASPPVPQAGRYRVRASVYAVGSGGKPLPVNCSGGMEWGRDDKDVRAVFDVGEGKPTVIDGEFDLKPRQVISLLGWSLPTVRDFAQGRKKGQSLDGYAGPGLAVEWIEVEGPLEAWPPAGYERLFGGVPLRPQSVARAIAAGQVPPPEQANRKPDSYIYDPLVTVPVDAKADARRLLARFLPQAFRRPVPDELLGYYVKLVEGRLGQGLSFQDAMVAGYKAALCSPHFLFLTERVGDAPAGRAGALDDYAIAARLSYFLWSTGPDEALIALAAKGELGAPAALHAQVERMLNDPRARRFVDDFAGQWLDLRNINATSPDQYAYPEFDDFLFWSMPRETGAFFTEVLRDDRPLTEFVQSDWTFLNQRLAQHYGIAGVFGGELRKVALPPGCHRGGVLTQAAILKVTADGTRTSPVIRGAWVLDRMLGKPPSPPPPGTPTIEPDIRGATTIRQQLDKHRNTPACAACHDQIDPPGFALESFDVIGNWREFYRATKSGRGLVDLPNYPGRRVLRGPDVETGGRTADGRAFADVDAYKAILLSDKDQLARALARKLIVYATGADVQFADREVVEELVAKSRAKNYGFRSLVHDVVQSRVFLSK